MIDPALPIASSHPCRMLCCLLVVHLKTCEALGKAVSRNPLERLSMPELTTLLRDLARETQAYEKTLAAAPPGLGLRPGGPLLRDLGLPPVLNNERLIPLADGTSGGDSTIAHASGLPAVEPVGNDGGYNGNIPGRLAEETRSSHLPLEGQLEAQRMPPMERFQFARPHPAGLHAGGEDVGAGFATVPPAGGVEAPHAEGDIGGAGAAAVRPAEAAEAPHGPSPIDSAPHAEGQRMPSTETALPSLGDIDGWMALMPPTPSVSAARALATRFTDHLRSLRRLLRLKNATTPVASVDGLDLPFAFATSTPADDVATPPAAASPVRLSEPS